MTNIAFDPAAFRAAFPYFVNAMTFPDATLQAFFDTATAYVTPEEGVPGCWPGGWTLAQQTLGINLMTAHIGFMFNSAATNQPTGIMVSASIDKIRVEVKPPPIQNGSMFQWWLAQSPYGAQLLALLGVLAAGGRYIGGSPERSGFASAATLGFYGRGRW